MTNVYASFDTSGPNHYAIKSDASGGSADSPMRNHALLADASWYRFEGEAGTRMPTQYLTEGTARCGGQYCRPDGLHLAHGLLSQ